MSDEIDDCEGSDCEGDPVLGNWEYDTTCTISPLYIPRVLRLIQRIKEATIGTARLILDSYSGKEVSRQDYITPYHVYARDMQACGPWRDFWRKKQIWQL
jgi:hypothetical protein